MFSHELNARQRFFEEKYRSRAYGGARTRTGARSEHAAVEKDEVHYRAGYQLETKASMECKVKPNTNLLKYLSWRGGRVVEGAALEKQYAGNRTEGSNPSLSAIRLPAVAHG